jgi:hypothetical protein
MARADCAPPVVPSPLIEPLLLAQTLLVGRVTLSLLPPGRLGSHRLGELAATLSASVLLGYAVTLVADLPAVVLGLPSLPVGTLASLALGAAVLRWMTLPGAFVPSPFPSVDSPSTTGVAGRWASALTILLGLMRAEGATELTAAWHALTLEHLPFLALPALLDHALRQLDQADRPRTWVWVLPAVLVWVLPAEVLLHGELPWVAFLLGGGAGFLLVWRRNADRRALAVSALAFGASTCSAAAVWPLGLAGLVWLVLATPGGTRALALRWGIVSVALLGPVAVAERDRLLSGAIDPAHLPPTLRPPGVGALLLAAALPLGLIALATWGDRRSGGTPRS